MTIGQNIYNVVLVAIMLCVVGLSVVAWGEDGIGAASFGLVQGLVLIQLSRVLSWVVAGQSTLFPDWSSVERKPKTPKSPSTKQSTSNAEALLKWKALEESGAISKEEFEKQKKALLDT
ncbi:SHOCT domain-containing protein [Vibrio breoganii]